jgi:hypothetical protein
MNKYFLIILCFLIFNSCNSINNISIISYASPDIFIECKLNDNIIIEEYLENNYGKYGSIKMNNINVTVLLKSININQLDKNNKIYLINNISNNILNNYSNNISDNLVNFIEEIFMEINVYTFGNNKHILIKDKYYFLDKKNMQIKKGIFGYKIEYIIRI